MKGARSGNSADRAVRYASCRPHTGEAVFREEFEPGQMCTVYSKHRVSEQSMGEEALRKRSLCVVSNNRFGYRAALARVECGEWAESATRVLDKGTVPFMEIEVVRETISREVLTEIAKRQFGDMVKAVVDVEQGILAIGGELHSDEEATLLDQGSAQRHLWGINLYPDKPLNEWIEFDSMINVRPSAGNRSRYVESSEIREAVTRIVNRLVRG